MIIQDVMEELAEGRIGVSDAADHILGVDPSIEEGFGDFLKKAKGKFLAAKDKLGAHLQQKRQERIASSRERRAQAVNPPKSGSKSPEFYARNYAKKEKPSYEKPKRDDTRKYPKNEQAIRDANEAIARGHSKFSKGPSPARKKPPATKVRTERPKWLDDRAMRKSVERNLRKWFLKKP